MSDERSPDGAPVLRDASTVMLLRDGAAGLEVFLLQRVAGMAFAGGMTVFPGGGVDPSDRDADIAWTGPDPAWWAGRWGVDEPSARALVLAAVRETFEECGVLLAGVDADSTIADTTGFDEDRRRLEGREISFGDYLADRGWVLRADLLRPWANWITPVGETTRRYDTRFFVAALPEGQEADGRTSEAARVSWSTPGAAIDEWRAGRSVLLPPTWSQLRALADHDSVASVLAAEPEIEPILPILRGEGRELRVDFPNPGTYYDDRPHPWSER